MMTTVSKTGYLRYEDKELDEDSWKIVKQDVKETEENKKKCLDIIKRKLLAIEDLNANLSDNFLLAFLRVCKYDVDKTYQRIIRYYEDRISMPEVFRDYTPSSVEVVRAARHFYLSPYRSKKDNSAIFMWKRGCYDSSKHPYELIIRYTILAVDCSILEKLNQLCGVTILVDMKTPSWASSWSEFTPGRLRLIANLGQKSMPIRIRGIHIINASPIYYLFYSIVYPFLSTKMRNRIHLHKNYESLHACIDPEILPKEYGGQLEQSDLIDVFELMCENEDHFAKLSKYGFIKQKK